MGIRTKALFTILLVGVVVGGFVYSSSNKNLFEGSIFNKNETTNTEVQVLPDLVPELTYTKPETQDGSLTVSAAIKNSGEGNIAGDKAFKYTLYINDQEVFSNVDSYSAMNPGDNFSFDYPIAKSVYNYPDSGKIKFILDTENVIEESNEDNNTVEIPYAL